MDPNDKLCLCFHVSCRKVVNFLRIENPKRLSQMSDCFGAGTGCGWCRPFLKRLFEEHQAGQSSDATDMPSSADYADARSAYVRSGKGTPPPGAEPIRPGKEDDDAPRST